MEIYLYGLGRKIFNKGTSQQSFFVLDRKILRDARWSYHNSCFCMNRNWSFNVNDVKMHLVARAKLCKSSAAPHYITSRYNGIIILLMCKTPSSLAFEFRSELIRGLRAFAVDIQKMNVFVTKLFKYIAGTVICRRNISPMFVYW